MTQKENIPPALQNLENALIDELKDPEEVFDEDENPGDPQPVAFLAELYLNAIRGINQAAQIALPHIEKWKINEIDKTRKKIDKLVPGLSNEKGMRTLEFESAREFADFTSTARHLEDLRSNNPAGVLAKSLFTQMFAELDAYVGELLKAIYLKNDSLLKSISREISLSDLLCFQSIDDVKVSMLDKEIETFRRDSYIEQFSTLEKKFSLPLRKFKEWPEFVELSQRRNILIHNGGMVSDQYLAVCDREGYKFKKRPSIGDSLGVSPEYFSNAGRLLSKIGLMLAYTLWSKISPSEKETIHESLNNTIYRCLQQELWNFVADLEDFVLSEPMRKGVSERTLRVRIVNAAIGLKFSNQDAKAVELLESVDWSASYRDFKLAIAVLHENYEEAVEIMKSIGRTGEIICQPDYHTWPLFTRFRERPEFYEAYFSVYGEPFAEKIETNKGAVEAHAKSSETQNNEELKSNSAEKNNNETSSASETNKQATKKKPRTSRKIHEE